MSNKALRSINWIVYMSLFIFVIFYRQGSISPRPFHNEHLIKAIEQGLEADGYVINYHLKMYQASEIISGFQLEGETQWDLNHRQQSGVFNLYTHAMDLGLLEGAYYLGDDYLALSLPRLLSAPYYLPYEPLDEHNQLDRMALEELLKEAEYIGREAVTFTNEQEKTFNYWLYNYQLVWEAKELEPWLEEINEQLPLAEEHSNINDLTNISVVLNAYIDNEEEIKKLKIEVYNTEDAKLLFEGNFSLQAMSEEAINITQIEKAQ